MAKPYNTSHKEGSESSYYWSSKYLEAEKKRIPPSHRGDQDMTESLKNVNPWVEVRTIFVFFVYINRYIIFFLMCFNLYL